MDKDYATKFILKACNSGYKLLQSLEKHGHVETLAYKMYAALFRNRHEGHFRVTRKFSSPRDFIDFNPSQGQPSLITPGLDINPRNKVDFNATQFEIAKDLVNDAINSASGKKKKHLREHYQDLLCSGYRAYTFGEGTNAIVLPLHKLPHRSEFDLFFTDGVVRRAADIKWDKIVSQVRGALIPFPYSNSDLDALIGSKQYQYCLARMVAKCQKLPPKQFDQWLRNARQHGFLALIENGSKLVGNEKESASRQAEMMFCKLLWEAYEHMARCYGVLMWLIWLHLCIDEEMETTFVEEKIFRSLHLPQMYLAGLPLSFFTSYQTRWLAGPLWERWFEGRFDAEAYDELTNMLGIFASLTQNRREADRRNKRSAGVTGELSEEPSEEADFELLLNARPWKESTDCPECRQPLSGERVIPDTSRFVFAAYCKDCGKEFAFWMNRTAAGL
jgi:hypothetical protein